LTAVVEVLHNSIRPEASLAALVADIALAAMIPVKQPTGRIIVSAGTVIEYGETNIAEIDEVGQVVRLLTTDQAITTGRHNCAAIYIHSEVRHKGQLLGYTIFEPNCMVEDGRMLSLNGLEKIAISYV
jgi:hypothetical protein